MRLPDKHAVAAAVLVGAVLLLYSLRQQLDVTQEDGQTSGRRGTLRAAGPATGGDGAASASSTSRPPSRRTLVLYTVFAHWDAELEWEFCRLVAQVTRAESLRHHDVALVFETNSRDAATLTPASVYDSVLTTPSHGPYNTTGLVMCTRGAAGRVSYFRTTSADAGAGLPKATFSKGFYYNPEVAAMRYLNATTRHYDFVWILESDVRWTVRVEEKGGRGSELQLGRQE